MEDLITIDPGKSGGIAWRINDEVFCAKMPETIKDMVYFFEDLIAEKGITNVVMEKVGNHVMGNSASSSVKFARHCGQLEGVIITLGFSLVEVTPQKWMKKLGSLPKEKKDRKNKIKEITQMKYPNLKVTLALSDALGIMITEEN